MTDRDSRVEEYLSDLKKAGRSSPDGIAWQQFFETLRKRKRSTGGDPPVPIILAASGESNAVKHRRLGAQLDWARENGCLDEALATLQSIPNDQWNIGSLTRWEKDNY